MGTESQRRRVEGVTAVTGVAETEALEVAWSRARAFIKALAERPAKPGAPASRRWTRDELYETVRAPGPGAMLAARGTAGMTQLQEDTLLARIVVNPEIFGGKPIVRGRRLAVEHVLGMLAAGDSVDDLLREYPWLERDDVQACLVYAKRLVGHERVEPAVQSPGA
jgi:uncharacterized protein (DUF433 family)